MSEMPKDILMQLQEQRAQFIQKRDFAQNNLNQLIGAIYACEVMIKLHEDEATKGIKGEEDGKTESNQEEHAA